MCYGRKLLKTAEFIVFEDVHRTNPGTVQLHVKFYDDNFLRYLDINCQIDDLSNNLKSYMVKKIHADIWRTLHFRHTFIGIV